MFDFDDLEEAEDTTRDVASDQAPPAEAQPASEPKEEEVTPPQAEDLPADVKEPALGPESAQDSAAGEGAEEPPVEPAGQIEELPPVSQEEEPEPSLTEEAQEVFVGRGTFELPPAPWLQVTSDNLQDVGGHFHTSADTAGAAAVRTVPAGVAPAASVKEGATRIAVNSQFVCYADLEGTNVLVLSSNPSASANKMKVASIDSHGARVLDLALDPKDSHLLVAFDSWRAELHRLPHVGPQVLLKFEESRVLAVEWHPVDQKVFMTLHESYILLWHLQNIVLHTALQPAAVRAAAEKEAKNQINVTADVQSNVACKASTESCEAALERMAMTPDGSHLMAISRNRLWLWSLGVEGVWPATADPLGSVKLAQAFQHRVVKLCVAKADAKAFSWMLLAASAMEVSILKLTQSDSDGRLIVTQQMISFPSFVSVELLFSQHADSCFPTPEVAVIAQVGETEDEASILLRGVVDVFQGSILTLEVAPVAKARGSSIGVVVEGVHLLLPTPSLQGEIEEVCAEEPPPSPPPGLERIQQAPVHHRPPGPPPGLPPPGLEAQPQPPPPPPGPAPQRPAYESSSLDMGLGADAHADMPAQQPHHPPPRGSAQPPATESSDDLGGGAKAKAGTSVQEIASFMQKRADRASEAVVDLVLARLPEALHSSGVEAQLQSEVAELRKQAGAAEQRAAKALRRLSDVEALKQTPGYRKIKEHLAEEMKQWKDPALPKVLLHLLETSEFADSFAQNLAQPSQAQSPLMQALRPSKQQLQEALRDDYKDWCGKEVAQKVRELFQAGGLPEVRAAMDSALKEVSAMYMQTMKRLLEDVHNNAKATQLVSACEQSVRTAVQREVQTFEAELKKRSATSRSSSAASAGDQASLRDGFLSRLRRAAAPISAELRAAEAALATAGDSLATARMQRADALNGSQGEGGNAAVSDSSSECLADRGIYKAYPGNAKPNRWS